MRPKNHLPTKTSPNRRSFVTKKKTPPIPNTSHAKPEKPIEFHSQAITLHLPNSSKTHAATNNTVIPQASYIRCYTKPRGCTCSRRCSGSSSSSGVYSPRAAYYETGRTRNSGLGGYSRRAAAARARQRMDFLAFARRAPAVVASTDRISRRVRLLRREVFRAAGDFSPGIFGRSRGGICVISTAAQSLMKTSTVVLIEPFADVIMIRLILIRCSASGCVQNNDDF